MLGFCLIWAARGSIHRAQSNGESGQPCLVPFEMGKEVDAAKGVLIEAGGVAYRCLIALRNGPESPDFQGWRTLKAS